MIVAPLVVSVFEAEDLAAIVAQPVQGELPEPSADRLRRGKALAAGGQAWTGRCATSGDVLFCGGLVELHPGHASAWSVFAAAAIASPRAMVAIRQRVAWFLGRVTYKRLDAVVRSEHRGGHLWAHRLGFHPEARLNDWFPDGSDAVLYRYGGM